MIQFLNVLKALIKMFQLAGGTLFVFVLIKMGYKAMWSKQTREEIKEDLLYGIIGLILVRGGFPIAQYIESLIAF